jgi:hypothetical protein
MRGAGPPRSSARFGLVTCSTPASRRPSIVSCSVLAKLRTVEPVGEGKDSSTRTTEIPPKRRRQRQGRPQLPKTPAFSLLHSRSCPVAQEDRNGISKRACSNLSLDDCYRRLVHGRLSPKNDAGPPRRRKR